VVKVVGIFSGQLKIDISRNNFEEFRAEHLLVSDSENALNQPFELLPGHNLCICSLLMSSFSGIDCEKPARLELESYTVELKTLGMGCGSRAFTFWHAL
jgi:hypothetical protein